MLFPLDNIKTSVMFGKDVNTDDFGSIGKGNFTVTKRIKIDELQPRQTELCGGTLNYKMKGKGFTTAFVIIKGNDKVIIDGHHTVIVKKLKGYKFVYAKCYLFS
jgi:hypothetical protein